MSTVGPNLVARVHPKAPAYYLVGAADRAMALLDETSAVGFEAVLELSGVLDLTALEMAWTRLVSLHPILACIRNRDRWQPTEMPPLGDDVPQLTHDRPPVALRIDHRPEVVRVTLMCNHVALDGTASRLLLADLREEYEAVLYDRPERPSDRTPRTLEAWVGTTDWRASAAASVRSATVWWQTPPSTHVDPGPGVEERADDCDLLELGPLLEYFTEARRRYRWSVDAVLVGILEKAWARVFGEPRADSTWLVARDLRPALGIGGGIGNLSVAAGVSFPNPDATLTETIDRAEATLATQADDLVTAGKAMGRWNSLTDVAFAQMVRRGMRLRAFRSLSNVGQLGASLDNWGDATLERVWFVGPLADPPYNSFIATGHGASTLVTVRTSPTWLTKEHARALERAALELV
ncbi:MAG TPA: hypothetical protein VFP42_09670 [Acidimicrobiia bacterium]|nr:hypothetical protein [Acidimicrobiia bacterium]